MYAHFRTPVWLHVNWNESVRVATTGAYVFRCVASVAHLFIFGDQKMRLLLVVLTDQYPFDIVSFTCREYDEIIIPEGLGLSELSKFCVDAMQKTMRVLAPKRYLYGEEEALEKWKRDMVEQADGILIIYNEEKDEIKTLISHAQSLGKRLDVICI